MVNDKLLKRTNCPNCGAPIEHYYNYTCPYCKTFLHNTDGEIKKLNNQDISIKNVVIEQENLSNSFILTIYGISTPRFNYYEEGSMDLYVIVSDKPCNIGYNIRIPFELIYNHNIDELFDYIFHAIPPAIKNYSYNMDIIYDKILDFLRTNNIARII